MSSELNGPRSQGQDPYAFFNADKTPTTLNSAEAQAQDAKDIHNHVLAQYGNTSYLSETMPTFSQASARQHETPDSTWTKNVGNRLDEMREGFNENKGQAIGGGLLTACTFPLCVIGGAIGGLIGALAGIKKGISKDKKAEKNGENASDSASGSYMSATDKNDMIHTVGKKSKTKQSFFERHSERISKSFEDGAKIGASVGSLGGFFLLHQALFGNRMVPLE